MDLKGVKKLYSLDCKPDIFISYIKSFFKVLNKKLISNDSPRFLGSYDKNAYSTLIKKYSKIPDKCKDPIKACNKLVFDLFSGVPRWKSPLLQYNVGAPANIPATAVYSLALEENIYNINAGLAGNALVAEQAVFNILSKLARLKTKGLGLFTFGGTATNFYALKVGSKKAFPESGKEGMPKNIKVFVTKDSHFSHTVAADWLGIGINNVIVMECNADRTTDLIKAEAKMREVLSNGDKISTIIINGGTTYGHVIDDILGFVKLRDRLVNDYSLDYKPHLHVDSVIGWAWLMFGDY